MNRIKILMAAFVLVAAGNLSAQSLTDVTTKFTEAATAMQAKDFGKAIQLFEQVINEGADVEGADEMVTGAKKYLPQALYVRGGSSFQGGDLDGALADFTKAAEYAELYGEAGVLNNAHTWIGRTVMRQGADAFNNKDYAAAAAIFQKGYDANPNDTDVALNLAMSYSQMGDYEKGNAVYKNIIALEGRNSRFDAPVAKAKQEYAENNIIRANEMAQARDYNGALAIIDEIIAVVPNSPEASLFRIQTYNNMKSYDKVIEYGDAAVAAQADPAQISAVNFLVGVAYQNKENKAKAIEYYRKVDGAQAAAAKAQIAELQK